MRCARQFHHLFICMRVTFAKGASRPRVNVPPVFLRKYGWKHPQHIAISFANVLSEMATTTCRTSSSYSFDICCSRGISVAPLTSVSCMPQVYVTLRNFRQGERESWSSLLLTQDNLWVVCFRNQRKSVAFIYIYMTVLFKTFMLLCKRILQRKIIPSKKLYLCKIIMLDIWLFSLLYLLYFSYLLYIKDDVCVPRVLEINQFFNFLN